MTGMRRARVLDEGFRLIQRLLLAKPAAGVNAARYGIPDGDWSQPPDLAGAQATPRSGDHPAEPGRHACSRFTLHGVPGPQRRQQKLPVGFRPRESCAGALPRRDVPNFCDFHITQTLRLSLRRKAPEDVTDMAGIAILKVGCLPVRELAVANGKIETRYSHASGR